MTIKELNEKIAAGTIKESHTSLFRGYVGRTKEITEARPYDGKFGKGYTVCKPNWDSSQYSYVTYYLEV